MSRSAGEGSGTDIAVIGAGPVGLFAAAVLAERGAAHKVNVHVFDEGRRASLHSYALALHPRSLALLDEVGLAGPLIAEGLRVARVRLRAEGKERGVLDFSRLAGPYPFLLVLPQSRLEQALEARLREQGVRVQWNHRVARIESGPREVRLEVAALDQVAQGYPVSRLEWVVTGTATLTVRAAIAADGYDSFTRRALGIGTAARGAPQTFAVFEFTTAGDALPDDAVLEFHEDTANVFWPLGPRRGRFSFEVPERQELTQDALLGLIAGRAPWFTARPERVTWSSLVTFERRFAERCAEGAVGLAGDAAHLTGPLGAQSMNVGLAEARALAARLIEALAPGGPELGRALQDYDAERRREWRALLDPGASVAALPGADPWIAAHRAALLACIPASGPDLDPLLRQVALAYQPFAGLPSE